MKENKNMKSWNTLYTPFKVSKSPETKVADRSGWNRLKLWILWRNEIQSYFKNLIF